jgi:hypothetical protein
MDEAWRSKGIKNRMEFFRGAIAHYLTQLGARDVAALFEGEGSARVKPARSAEGVDLNESVRAYLEFADTTPAEAARRRAPRYRSSSSSFAVSMNRRSGAERWLRLG